MGITAISRDWGVDPQIVRIVTTDTIGAIATAGYWATQQDELLAINRGDFQWLDTDIALIAYDGGKGFFEFDAATGSFLTQGNQSMQIAVSSAEILGMSAAPVVLLPAPGAGKKYVLTSIVGTYLFGTVQYANGGAIGLQFGDVALLAGEPASNTLAAATFNGYAADNSFVLVPDNVNVLANVVNQPVTLSNDTAPFINGDGTLLLDIDFKIVSVA